MSSSDPRGQLTPVTVLFADISGSTTLYAQRSDMTAFSLATACLSVVERGIASVGGRVVKRLGDGLLAVFGQPEQALRAAVDSRAALAATDQTTEGESLRIRFGISCGAAVLAADDVFGDVVNVAARLVALAGPDEILLSGGAHEELTVGFRSQAHLIDALALRNRPRAVPVYKFIGAEPDSTSPFNPPVPRAQATLSIKHGQTRFVLGPQRQRLSIGRHASSDICLDHAAVSRLHAEILARGDKFVLADRSTNGTFVHTQNGFVLRLLREELTLSQSGRIVAAVENGPAILFRVTDG